MKSMTSSSVKRCLANAAGFVGKGWVSAARSPGTSLAGTGAVLDGPDRLAGHPVEDVDEAGLRGSGDRVDLPAVHVDGEQGGRGRQVVVPEAVLHGLEVPDPLAGAGVEADDGLREEVVAEAVSAVVVVARRPDREVDEPPFGVEGHGRPDVRVADSVPGAVLPGVVAELAGLRDQVEGPDQLAGFGAERLHVAWRIALVDEAVPDAVPHDHQVLEDDRRGGLRVVEAVDGPEELRGEVDLAAVTEGGVGLAGDGVDRDEPPAAVQEDAPVAALGLPERDPAVDEPGAVRDLSPLGDPRVVGPKHLAGVGVQRHHLVVGGAHVHHPVVDQRGVLEAAGPHRVVGNGQPGPAERPLAGVPLPGQLQVRDVVPVDLGQRGVVHRAGIAAPGGPFDARGGGVFRLGGSFGRERGEEEQDGESGHGGDYRGEWGGSAGLQTGTRGAPHRARLNPIHAHRGATGLERRPPVGTRGAPHRARLKR